MAASLPDLLTSGASAELRDARTLACLVDPSGDHGLGQALLVTFATHLAARGRPELSRRLATPSPLPLQVELRLRDGRVELIVAAAGRELLLPWRARARSEDADLAGLPGPEVDLLGLGPDAGVFPPGTPVLGWAELVQALDALPVPPGTGWAPVVATFRERLGARVGLPAPPARDPAPAQPPSGRHARPAPPAPTPQPPPTRTVARPVRPAPAPAPPAPESAASMTRRFQRPAGQPDRAQELLALAERLLSEVPWLARRVPGATPPPVKPRAWAESSIATSPTEKGRTYLVHKELGRGGEASVYEVLVQGNASFPGFDEEVAVAAIKVPHEGSDVLERERAVLSRPHPALVRLLAVEPGARPFLLLERLAPHPFGAFGRCDPVTAIHTFVHLLAALPSVHERLERILCGIEPANVMLRMPGEAGTGPDYLTRLGAGTWEPVLIDQGGALAGGAPPPPIVGDPLWLAPESIPRPTGPGRHTRKSDVYALTLTFYTLLTGEQPYAWTDLHQRKGAAWLGELFLLKEKGTSPVNGHLVHEAFPPPLAEALLELLRAGLAADPGQRKSAEELLQLAQSKLALGARRPPVAADAYVWDDPPGLQWVQRKLPPGDLRAFYGP